MAVTLRLRPSWQAVLRPEFEGKCQGPVAERFKHSWGESFTQGSRRHLREVSFWRPFCISEISGARSRNRRSGMAAPPSFGASHAPHGQSPADPNQVRIADKPPGAVTKRWGITWHKSLKSVFVLEPGPLLLHPRGPVSHDGDRLRSVQAWRQREDSLTVGGNVVPVAVPVQQPSKHRMHLSGLKLSAVEDIREVSFFSGVLWSTSPHTSC